MLARFLSQPSYTERLARQGRHAWDAVSERTGDVWDDLSERGQHAWDRVSDLPPADAARGLGWASIGIGLAEIAAPKQVQSMLGIEDRPQHRGILRVLGLRELLHGVSILTEHRPNAAMTAGVWSRVAGDVLDTALLGVAATKTRRPGSFAGVAASVLAIGLMDMLTAVRLQRRQH